MELLFSIIVAAILFVVFIMPCGIIASSIVKAAFKIGNDERHTSAKVINQAISMNLRQS
jgi:hypothetical protein